MLKKNNHVIFQIELSKIDFITKTLLDALTVQHFPVNFGIKREKFYILNANRRINNFNGTIEVEAMNLLFQACSAKGYSLIMIKI